MNGRGRATALQKEGNRGITRHPSQEGSALGGKDGGRKEKRKCVVLGGDQVGVI